MVFVYFFINANEQMFKGNQVNEKNNYSSSSSKGSSKLSAPGPNEL